MGGMQRHKQEGNGPTGVLLTREEVGERLAISPRTVARLVARGELPVVRIGRLARYRGTDVTAVIEACLETERSLGGRRAFKSVTREEVGASDH